MPVTVSDSAILKVPGILPISFRAIKLNACLMARVYDTVLNILIAKILGYATLSQYKKGSNTR